MVELQSGASVPPRLSLMHQAQQPQQALQPKQALQLQQQPRRGRRRAMRTAMQMQSIIGRSLDQAQGGLPQHPRRRQWRGGSPTPASPGPPVPAATSVPAVSAVSASAAASALPCWCCAGGGGLLCFPAQHAVLSPHAACAAHCAAHGACLQPLWSTQLIGYSQQHESPEHSTCLPVRPRGLRRGLPAAWLGERRGDCWEVERKVDRQSSERTRWPTKALRRPTDPPSSKGCQQLAVRPGSWIHDISIPILANENANEPYS